MTKKREPPSAETTMADQGKTQRLEGPTTDIPATHHLVVGFDRCPSSQQALRFAITLAAPLNAHLHVAHIIDLEDFPIDPDSDDWEERAADALAQERTQACDLLRALPGNWTYYARRGDPAHVLSALADTHDALMIVIGAARGGLMSALDRALGESVSAHLLRHAHRPVVVVPDAPHDT
jgi:nucleotide-binding universal stress UspA family protein